MGLAEKRARPPGSILTPSQPPAVSPRSPSGSAGSGAPRRTPWLWRYRWRPYALAILLTLGTLAVLMWASAGAGGRPLLNLLVVSIVLSAHVGGRGPGLLAMAVAALGSSYFLLPPYFILRIGDPADVLHWLALIATGTLVSLLAGPRGRAIAPLGAPTAGAIERMLRAGFALALGCVGVVALVSYGSLNRLYQNAEATRRSEALISAVHGIVGLVTDAETAQRGYALMGDPAYLDPYTEALGRAESELRELQVLAAASSPWQSSHARTLEQLVRQRLQTVTEAIEARRAGGVPAVQAAIAGGLGKAPQDLIRTRAQQMAAAERDLLAERLQELQQSRDLTTGVIFGGSLLALAVAAVSLYAFERDLAGRRRARAELEEANRLLESRVQERTEELARSHEAARRSEARLGGIVGSAMDAIISVDAAQRIVLFNAAAERLFGCTAAEVQGQTLDRFVPARFQAQHQGHIEAFGATGETSRSMRSLGDLVARRANGEEFPIEASISQIDVAGEKIYTVILRDVTERKRAETAAAELAAIVESSYDAIVGKDLNGQVKTWNAGAERVFGYTAAEMVGSSISIVIPPERAADEHEIMSRIRRGEAAEHFETVRRRKDGRLIDVSVTVSPIRDADGTIIGASKVARDISEQKEAQAALRDSEELFSAAFRYSPAGLAINRRRDLINLEVNDSFLRLFECRREEIVGHTLVEAGLLPPASVQRIRELLDAEGSVQIEELEARTRGGRPIFVRLSTKVIQLRGAPCSISIVLDVTARREANEERAKLARLVEHSTDFIGIADLDGRVTFLNPGARRMIGLAADADPAQLHFTDYVPPAWQDFFLQVVIPTVREEGIWEGEMQLQHLTTGALVDVFRTSFLLRDAEGRPLYLATVTRDITERKRAETQLREKEAQLHATDRRLAETVQGMSESVIALDADWNFTFVNDRGETLLGRPREELIGRRLWELYPHVIGTPTELHYRRAMEQQVPVAFETYSTVAQLWLDIRIFPTGDGVAAFALDITTRKAAEEGLHRLNADLEERVRARTLELEAANKELESFSYSVSHDLRGPLRAMDGFSRATSEEFGPLLPPEGRRYLQIIRDSAGQMGALIDDLLNFSRLSRQPLARREIDTSTLVRDIVRDQLSDAPDRTIDVRVGSLPACEGDPALLRQVWVNLLSNAIKYTREQSPAVIEVGARAEGSATVFFVRDNGAGFDMRYAGKLFGVFQRLHLAEDYEGTGVGLAIVQRVIHRHGGRVWAEAAVGRGATFYFTLNDAHDP